MEDDGVDPLQTPVVQAPVHPARGLRQRNPVVEKNTTTPRNHLLYPPTSPTSTPRTSLHDAHKCFRSGNTSQKNPCRKAALKKQRKLRSRVSSCRTYRRLNFRVSNFVTFFVISTVVETKFVMQNLSIFSLSSYVSVSLYVSVSPYISIMESACV